MSGKGKRKQRDEAPAMPVHQKAAYKATEDAMEVLLKLAIGASLAGDQDAIKILSFLTLPRKEEKEEENEAVASFSPSVDPILCTKCGNRGPGQCECEIDTSETKKKKAVTYHTEVCMKEHWPEFTSFGMHHTFYGDVKWLGPAHKHAITTWSEKEAACGATHCTWDLSESGVALRHPHYNPKINHNLLPVVPIPLGFWPELPKLTEKLDVVFKGEGVSLPTQLSPNVKEWVKDKLSRARKEDKHIFLFTEVGVDYIIK